MSLNVSLFWPRFCFCLPLNTCIFLKSPSYPFKDNIALPGSSVLLIRQAYFSWFSGKESYRQAGEKVRSLDHEGMATLSSILAWEIPWTEEPGRLQSMGSQKNWT